MDKFVENQKNILEQEYQNLSARLERLEKSIHHVDAPADPDWAEQAVENENNEVLDALDDSTRDKLQHIETALSRIENDTYGICTSCGEDVSRKRLKSLPETNLCVNCAA